MTAPQSRRQVDPEALGLAIYGTSQDQPQRHAPTVAPVNPSTSGSPSGRGTDSAKLIRRFALGAGIPPSTIQGRDAGALAEEMGLLVKFVATSLTQLLAACAQTKRMARSANHTMIQPQENNPLKFALTVEEALQLMFGARTSGFLDDSIPFRRAFAILTLIRSRRFQRCSTPCGCWPKSHDAISETVEADRGIGTVWRIPKGQALGCLCDPLAGEDSGPRQWARGRVHELLRGNLRAGRPR